MVKHLRRKNWFLPIPSFQTSLKFNSTFQFRYRGDALATTFSALYGKLLVVMGIAFPMAEVISTYIPPSFYEVSAVNI